ALMLRSRSFNLALILAILLAFLRLGPVMAHLDLNRSEPADGAVLETSPPVVRLWFNEELDTFESSVAVFDSAGRRVDLDDARVSLEDRTLMQVSLPADLPPGGYAARWTAVDDADGHAVEGELTFTIAGKPTQKATGLALPQSTTGILVIAVGAIIVAGAWTLRRRQKQG
ncbi:MAG: copper resistance protein CopC, partial [Anaerolineae bacterium]